MDCDAGPQARAASTGEQLLSADFKSTAVDEIADLRLMLVEYAAKVALRVSGCFDAAADRNEHRSRLTLR
jgi:hypothetical protein